MAEDTYIEIVETLPQKIADLVIALRSFLGENDMMAYLVMMAIRLQELRRVLKPTGSIYLHCDPTASHYLKLVMDAVFGHRGFRNEIVWHYSGWNARLRDSFNRRHDILLFYARNPHQEFNSYSLSWSSEAEYVRVRKQKVRVGEDGRKYVLSDAGKGRRVKRYLEEAIAYGKPVDDVWNIPKLNNSSKENLGYPTQKPEALLERIIEASSDKDSVILDPFCGCGTTINVAEKLRRDWIGIDITHLAISLMKHRLEDTFGNGVEYDVIGEPVDLRGAGQLAKDDPYQFQWWALGLVGARPAKSEQKKGPDEGIDGYIYFHDDPKKKETKAVIIQVKSGHIGSGMIDALKGVIEKKKAQIGVFITLQEPTKPMKVEAVSSGYYRSPLGHNYPRIQILTIKKLLEGKGISRPLEATGIDATFRKAERHKEKSKQKEMEFE
ncbi:hypothetical protein LCGC14_1630590 [marine sediment metagenome]|uniref:DNA methylase N-4/N-6 domain-containing protein n=1 Tax=marine sediment metagenome TaxID=412755 RepID=A0A0F9L2D4_9ZZZZ